MYYDHSKHLHAWAHVSCFFCISFFMHCSRICAALHNSTSAHRTKFLSNIVCGASKYLHKSSNDFLIKEFVCRIRYQTYRSAECHTMSECYCDYELPYLVKFSYRSSDNWGACYRYFRTWTIFTLIFHIEKNKCSEPSHSTAAFYFGQCYHPTVFHRKWK